MMMCACCWTPRSLFFRFSVSLRLWVFLLFLVLDFTGQSQWHTPSQDVILDHQRRTGNWAVLFQSNATVSLVGLVENLSISMRVLWSETEENSDSSITKNVSRVTRIPEHNKSKSLSHTICTHKRKWNYENRPRSCNLHQKTENEHEHSSTFERKTEYHKPTAPDVKGLKKNLKVFQKKPPKTVGKGKWSVASRGYKPTS